MSRVTGSVASHAPTDAGKVNDQRTPPPAPSASLVLIRRCQRGGWRRQGWVSGGGGAASRLRSKVQPEWVP